MDDTTSSLKPTTDDRNRFSVLNNPNNIVRAPVKAAGTRFRQRDLKLTVIESAAIDIGFEAILGLTPPSYSQDLKVASFPDDFILFTESAFANIPKYDWDMTFQGSIPHNFPATHHGDMDDLRISHCRLRKRLWRHEVQSFDSREAIQEIHEGMLSRAESITYHLKEQGWSFQLILTAYNPRPDNLPPWLQDYMDLRKIWWPAA